MGILGLTKLIAEYAPNAIKEGDIKNYFGRKVALDASMCLYQFLIAVRSDGAQLCSVDGETTSHLMGMFYRTIRLLENGLKPVYVFDGKPPDMKAGELAKRAERREEAEKQLQAAKDVGNVEDMDKFNRRLVRVTKDHAKEAKELLKLMGVPFVEAPCEAEAQCAALAKAGKVYATATEDMDALTFGSSILLRHLTFSEARKSPVMQYDYEKVLQGFQLTRDEFIDLCILLGCDYCEGIKGIGPKRAVELINNYRDIETILKHIDRKKYAVADDWNYKLARQLFIEPEVADPQNIELKWEAPDVDGLVEFLCGDRQFNEERVRAGAAKILKSKSAATQGRLENFFKVLPNTNANANGKPTPKRKADEDKKGTNKKPKTGGKVGAGKAKTAKKSK